MCLCAAGRLACFYLLSVVGNRRRLRLGSLDPAAVRCRCRCLEIGFFWVSSLLVNRILGRTRTGRRARSGGRASRIGTVSQPCAALIKKRVCQCASALVIGIRPGDGAMESRTHGLDEFTGFFTAGRAPDACRVTFAMDATTHDAWSSVSTLEDGYGP